MIHYLLKRLVILLWLVAILSLTAYLLYDSNSEHYLSQGVQTLVILASIIPITFTLLLTDAYLLKRKGLKKYQYLSLGMSLVVLLLGAFLVMTYIV